MDPRERFLNVCAAMLMRRPRPEPSLVFLCDVCAQNILTDTWWRCLECGTSPDFDVCQDCEKPPTSFLKSDRHLDGHNFKEITRAEALLTKAGAK